MEKTVAREADIPPDSFLAVEADGWDIVVFRQSDGTITALEDRCSHADVKLSAGSFEGGIVECMAHGARFDTCTGKHLCAPAFSDVRTFEVKISNGDVVLVLP